MAHSKAVPWTELPVDTWVAVLSHINVEHRLTVCAVVSQLFKEAALAATTAIVLRRVTTAKCTVVQEWLWRYKGQYNVRRVELLAPAQWSARTWRACSPNRGWQL
jgi:hypothetical protein